MLISKEYSFEASHVLPLHPGKCSRLHGHSYKLVVEIEGDVNDTTGFVTDYADMDTMIKPIVEMLDHRHLNCFIRTPTAENIAAHIAHLLRPRIQFVVVHRLVVRISETAKTWAVWDSRRQADIIRLQEEPQEAGWASPTYRIPLAPDVREILSFLDTASKAQRQVALETFKKFQEALTEAEQIDLYRKSLLVESTVGLDTRPQ